MCTAKVWTDDEMRSALFPTLGVYGFWIVEHGRKLDKSDEFVKRIMDAYQLFSARQENAAIALLMGSIDKFCEERNYPKPPNHIPKGW